MYFETVAREWPEVKPGNLKFYLTYLFRGVPLTGARVLDIGAGDGLYSLWPAVAGSRSVIALEPEAAGSSSGMQERFERAAKALGTDAVELRSETLQQFTPPPEPFDVLFLHASINHLDEPACTVLHREDWAREVYRGLLSQLAGMTAPGGKIVLVDASRGNLFAKLPVHNPVAKWIEWEKHQPPRLWASLLEEAGFESPRIRWNSFNSLRTPGRVLLGNRVAAWFLQSAFCLTMTRTSAPPGSRSTSAAATE